MATDSNFEQAAIPRFDGHYDHWSMLMENFLRSKEYWQIVESGIREPAEGTTLTETQKTNLETKRLKDLKAKNYLFQSIDRPVLETILCKETSKDIWDSMKKKYQGSARVKRAQLQALRRDFETLAMKDGESITNYFARTMEICNRMRFHGEKMQDVTIVEKILRSLTAKFDYVVCAIEESKDIDALFLDELQSSLLVHEQKMNRSTDSSIEEQALKISTDTRTKTFSGRGRGRGRGRGNSQSRGRGKYGQYQQHQREKERGKWSQIGNYKVDKSNVECYRCHQFGHYKSECRTNLSKEYGEKSNFAETAGEEVCLMTQCQGKESSKSVWYLDTACSNHMSGDKSAFSNLDEAYHDKVKLGDESRISIMGKGEVTILNKDNTNETIFNVFFVPDLKTNLLSVGQLLENGYELSFKGGACEIRDSKSVLIAEATRTENRMFPLYLNITSHKCFSVRMNDDVWLWHFRYGHLNFGGLRTLQQKNMVIGLPKITPPIEVCEECMISKQHRNKFPKGKSWRAKGILDLVHSDICGPIKPISNGGKSYLITFTDDFSRKTWVYFLQEKSEAFLAFKSFKARVENESERSIKVLRTDRGGEYCSNEFETYCDNHGIRRELTTAYTPQQNGVAERKNRTIFNMVRSLLARGRVPKTFGQKQSIGAFTF
ncbi:UNVERIFIED_CONTAM: Copia protein [Sesamum radiatum]|uniref:Copia protein n=1 Tax=Sesamum radiatum TaxID=300843 RepID=A0AAW2PXR4_SESRA